MGESVLTGVSMVLLLAACLLSIKVALLFRTAVASRNWPTVRGRVVSMDMDVTHLQSEEIYTPRLTYRYRVGAMDYEGSRIDLNRQRRFYSQSSANAVLAPYGPDQEVTVFYNPNKPADALLQPGVSKASWVIAGLIVVLLILLAFVVLGFRHL